MKTQSPKAVLFGQRSITGCFSYYFCLLVAVLALAGLPAVSANTSVAISPERAGHTSTLLPSGQVLIAAGVNTNGDLNSAILYNPANNTALSTGSLVSARENHTATLLNDGTVLITGGELVIGTKLKSAEIYNPATSVFTQLAHAMSIPRTKHTATLLQDGTVLVVGGKQADIYNPTTQRFTALLSLPVNRSSHAASLLQDGRVLITGGYVGKLASPTAEIYDPATGNFSATGLMIVPRANHTSTVMLDGRVLIAGGFAGTSPQNNCDIFDPATGIFTATTPMNYHRSNQNAVLLGNGLVEVIGGTTLESGFLAVNEAYDPTSQPPVWHILSPSMNENRSGSTATMLLDGNIFVATGVTGNVTLPSAEILNPTTLAFSPLPNLTVPRNQQTATLLPDGEVILIGGSTDSVFLSSAELFDPVSLTFASTSNNMQLARKSHTATLLQDNANILVAGGKSDSGDLKECELYNIAADHFSQVAQFNTGRSLFTSTLLPSGVVLSAAGRHGGTPTATAELYDPVAENFTNTGSMNTRRKRHRAVLLDDGTAFVSGGASLSNDQQPNSGTPTCEIYTPPNGQLPGKFLYTTDSSGHMTEMFFGRTEHESTKLADGTVLQSGGYLLSPCNAEIYHPTTQTFTQVGSLITQRNRHVAILLNNPVWGSRMNKVLIIGGANTGNSVFGGLENGLASCELFDPVSKTFSFFGNMITARQNHTATLLQDGRIMVAGGVSSPVVSGTGEILVTSVAPRPTPTPTP